MAVIPGVYRGQIEVATLRICLPVHWKTYLRKCGLNRLFMLLLACFYRFTVGIAHDQFIEGLFCLPFVVVLDSEGIVPPVSDYDQVGISLINHRFEKQMIGVFGKFIGFTVTEYMKEIVFAFF